MIETTIDTDVLTHVLRDRVESLHRLASAHLQGEPTDFAWRVEASLLVDDYNLARGGICKCGLAKSYHSNESMRVDHEYEPRYSSLQKSPFLDERRRVADGGHRMFDDGFGQAEAECDHGRSAHNNEVGCLHCACRVGYSVRLVKA